MIESSSSEEDTAVEHNVVLDLPAADPSTLHAATSKDADHGPTCSSNAGPRLHDASRKKTVTVMLAIIACVGAIIWLSVGLNSASNDRSSDVPQAPTSTDTSTSTTTTTTTTLWPHDSTDIEADSRVTYGVLNNGLRYAILPNSEPPHKLMLRMHVDAGSYQEEDDQRGLAHFLEHMAFNGLESFPDANDLIPQMQRLGIAFGAHANAYTSFDETVYMLDLPNATDESVLDLGFTVMRDYADGILMDPEEIEKERGVILAEKDARDSVSMRLWQKLYSFLLPNHRVSKRFPIGTEEVISTAPRQRFLDFYDEHYSPEQITFIAVGDTDVATMKERIIEAYESMESRRSPEDFEEIDLGTVSTGQGFRTAVYTDEELVHDRLFINVIRPYEMKDDTEDNRISALPLNIANRILSQRLKNVAKKEGSPFLSGSAYRDGWFLKSGVEWGEISLTPVSGGDSEWKACIPIIEQELRRAIEYGFAPFELEEQKANLLRSYQKAVDTASTQKSQALAKQVVDSINSKSVVSSPEENLRIIEKGVETITVEQLHDVFKSFWDTPDHTLVLYAKEAEANAVEEMNQIYENSKLSPVSPPDMTFDATFHYTSFGSAGTIVSDTYIEDLDVRQLKLSNKVRVNLKATDFEANTVRIVARFGSGSLSQPSAKSGIQWLAPIIINEGGLGKHSKTDLTRILAGNNVQQASFSISEDSFNIMGKTTPEDLELQLQLMAAYLSDPGYRPEAEQYWQNIIPSYPDWFAHTFDGVNYNVTTSFLRGHDGRFRVPSLEEMASLTADDVREWLHPEMIASYLEVSVVGDFDADLIIPFLLNSFGALPEREDSPAIMPSELTSLPYPPTPSEHLFAYESKMPHAAAMLVFRVPPLREDIRLTRRLNILSSVLRDRMRKEIREEQAASYGPVVYVTASESYDFGALIAYSKGSPENTAGMTNVIEALATNLTGAMTEDELLRAKEPTMTSLKDTLRSNTYWLNNVVSESQSKPWILDWSRERDDDYSSITVDEIIELARKFFTKENTMKIDIIPITNEE